MANILEYKCPCCGGAIGFESGTQKMKCPYCDTEFDVETLLSYDEQLSHDAPDEMNWETEDDTYDETDENALVSYVCTSCGGEIVGDRNTAATQCPFCNNPVIIMGKLAGTLKPDLVIPFKLDKEAAKKQFAAHMSGKKLLPKLFKSENHLDTIKGMYVPFWLFDADADANIRYRATRTSAWSDSHYNYTKTDYYSVTRAGTLSFDGVPSDGSVKIPDDLMESIEPFDLTQAVDFQTAYLAGFFADRYDVSADKCIPRVNERIKRSTEEAFMSTVTGYSSCTAEQSSVRTVNGKTRYGLLPVWFLNTTWKDKQYTFAMNGQTGKFVGDLPMDKSLYWKYFALIGGVGAAAVFGLLTLFDML